MTNDEALVTNLKLNFKVVVGGSEAALIESFRSAEKNKTRCSPTSTSRSGSSPR